MTVLDTSGAIDLLLGTGAGEQVRDLVEEEGTVAAPDVLTFELLAVLRRQTLRGALEPRRATGAVEDYGDLAVDLFPSTLLRTRAWELRERLTAADALFAALAEQLGEPLATKDAPLLRAARDLGLETVQLG